MEEKRFQPEGEIMRKSFWCKMGFHDWEIVQTENWGLTDRTLFKRVCLRDGCDAVYDGIAAHKQLKKGECERRKRAIQKYKAITEGKSA